MRNYVSPNSLCEIKIQPARFHQLYARNQQEVSILKIQFKVPNSVGPTHTYKREQVILSKEQCCETDICNFNEMSPQTTLKSDMVTFLFEK